MNTATFTAAITLILIGLIGYFTAAAPSPTALIPAGFGLLLALCGALAGKESLRKAAITIAMLIAAVGFIAASMRLPKSYAAWQTCSEGTCPLAFISQASMAAITLIYVVVGIRAFINKTK